MSGAELVVEVQLPEMNIPEVRNRILQIFRGNCETALKDASPVDEGYLREHWWSEIHEDRSEVQLSNATAYLPFLMSGTGLYGPKHQKILPKKKKALAWKNRATGQLMIRRAVRGIKPNPFVQEAIASGVDRSMADLKAMLDGGAL
jgi:hypothetical protein